MTVHRVLVYDDTSGRVICAEYHATDVAANERAASWRSRGFTADVTSGTRDESGGFTPGGSS